MLLVVGPSNAAETKHARLLKRIARKPRSMITGVGYAVPDKVVTNDDLARLVDTNDHWIVSRTGIKQRRYLEEGMATSDLATKAARKACRAAKVDPKDLDAILVATVTPDMQTPSTANLVQHKLGARTCAAFDISAACAGFLYAMNVADNFVRGGDYKKVLLIGAETLSRVTNFGDRGTCVLFGDAAGAAVMEASPDQRRGIIATKLYSDGGLADVLRIPAGGSARPANITTVTNAEHHIQMPSGAAVLKHAVEKMSCASTSVLAEHSLRPEDVDWVVAHQANARILEGVSKRVQIPMDRFVVNIERYGNTSAASIPLALGEALETGRIKAGDLVLFAALGAGLSWGAGLMLQ